MIDRRRVRQRDVTAAVKGLAKAGHAVSRVEIGVDGRVVIYPAGALAAPPENEWDDDLPASSRDDAGQPPLRP